MNKKDNLFKTSNESNSFLPKTFLESPKRIMPILKLPKSARKKKFYKFTIFHGSNRKTIKCMIETTKL